MITEPEALIWLLARFVAASLLLRDSAQIEKFPLVKVAKLFAAVGIRAFGKHRATPSSSWLPIVGI
jgi:hypothetical protein